MGIWIRHKISIISLATLFVLIIMTACSSGEEETTSNASNDNDEKSSEEETYTIRVSSVVGDNTPDSIAYEEFKEEIEKKSDGRIKIEYFPNGQLYGSEREAIEATQLKNIEMTTVATASIAGFIPEFSIFNLPYLFETLDDAHASLNGELGDKLNGMLTEIDLVSLGYGENSFRHFFNTKKPIEKPDDFSGMKVRVIENEMYEDLFNGLGASASPLSFGETYTALQQGVYDGLDSEITTAASAKFEEVTDYLTLTGHTYTALITVINKEFYESLPSDLQEILNECAETYSERQKELNRELEKENLEMLKEKMEVNELTSEQKEAFKEETRYLYDEYSDVLGKDLIELAKQASE